MEGKQKEARAGAAGDAAAATPRQEEATSGETLKDIERTESGATSKPTGGASGAGGTTETATPSPDGAFDSERGGRADRSDAGEPM